MPIIRMALSIAFIEEAMNAGCPVETLEEIRRELSRNPTSGRRIVSIFDDPFTYPGSGYYQNEFSFETESQLFRFDTLHLYLSPRHSGRVTGFSLREQNIVNFLSRFEIKEMRQAALLTLGILPDTEN